MHRAQASERDHGPVASAVRQGVVRRRQIRAARKEPPQGANQVRVGHPVLLGAFFQAGLSSRGERSKRSGDRAVGVQLDQVGQVAIDDTRCGWVHSSASMHDACPNPDTAIACRVGEEFETWGTGASALPSIGPEPENTGANSDVGVARETER